MSKLDFDRFAFNRRADLVSFDNTVAQLKNNPTNVQQALEGLGDSRFQYSQFQFIGRLNNTQYLYPFIHSGGETRRSGDASNGYRFQDSAPVTVPFPGEVTAATASIRGIAQSTGSPAANVEVVFELWKVGFTGEGTVLGNIVFDVDSSTYTIGNWWDSSIVTAFAEEQPQSVNVSAGDLLGLKFIQATGNNRATSIENTTVVLAIEGAV